MLPELTGPCWEMGAMSRRAPPQQSTARIERDSIRASALSWQWPTADARPTHRGRLKTVKLRAISRPTLSWFTGLGSGFFVDFGIVDRVSAPSRVPISK